MTPDNIKQYLPDDMKLQSCYLEVETSVLSKHEEVVKAVQDFSPNQGWLAFQSKIKFFYNADLIIEPDLPNGYLLNAELVNTETEALHIRDNGNGDWLLTHYKELQSETTQQAANALADKVFMLAKSKDNTPKNQSPKIIYRRYWKHSDLGYHVYAASFNGFENGENLS